MCWAKVESGQNSVWLQMCLDRRLLDYIWIRCRRFSGLIKALAFSLSLDPTFIKKMQIEIIINHISNAA